MPKLSYLKLPVVNLTQQQIDKRMADFKERFGRSLNFDEVGEPVAHSVSRIETPEDGVIPTLRRGRHKHRCRVLGPEEWNLVFPDIPSEYGGMVCF